MTITAPLVAHDRDAPGLTEPLCSRGRQIIPGRFGLTREKELSGLQSLLDSQLRWASPFRSIWVDVGESERKGFQGIRGNPFSAARTAMLKPVSAGASLCRNWRGQMAGVRQVCEENQRLPSHCQDTDKLSGTDS